MLYPETARICILVGAKYIVSPSLNTETVKLCNRYRIPIMPGVVSGVTLGPEKRTELLFKERSNNSNHNVYYYRKDLQVI